MTITDRDQAIAYLSRLTSLKDLDQKATSPFSHHQLLFALLEIQKAVIASKSGDLESFQLEIDPHGFPHLPFLLLNLKLAFTLQKENLKESKKNTSLLLDAISNLSFEKYAQSKKDLEQSAQINQPVVQALASLSVTQTKYLFEVCQPQPRALIPFFVRPQYPGILLAKIQLTPFYEQEYPDNKSADRLFFRKYFDAPNFPGLPVVYGTPESPLESNQKLPEQRFPVIAYGVDNFNVDLDSLECRSVISHNTEAYVRARGDGLVILGKNPTTIRNTDKPGSVQHLTGVQPETVHQVEQIFAKTVLPTLRQSLLNIDLGSATDQEANQILDSLPEVNSRLQAVLKTAQEITANQTVPDSDSLENPKKLIDLVNSLENPTVKDAIHRALQQTLAEEKLKLSGKEPELPGSL